MKENKIFIKLGFKLIFSFLIFANVFDNIPLKANEDLNNLESKYLLGPSDQINIKFRNISFFSGEYTSDASGFINMPEIGKININDMSVDELEKYLEKEYEKSIINPEITITIMNYRPFSVYISGEVKRPGLYRFNYENQDKIMMQRNNNTPLNFPNDSASIIPREDSFRSMNILQNTSPYIIPKVYDALKKASGVTNNADLTKIRIIRKNSKSQGGGKIETSINFVELLSKGDQSQNLRIFDGDSIFVSRSDKPLKDQILLASNSNMTPDSITVFITGNVKVAGSAVIPKGSSLVQAIASAGGKKSFTGKVEFIRFSDNGKTIKNKFNYKPNASINSRVNPILMDGDIINVRKTILGTGAELIKEVGTPVLSGYGLYQIFSN